jgi:hypothetical protein
MTNALDNGNQQDLAGYADDNVGQDVNGTQDESSNKDWETQAKYFQSEKDKLYVENESLKKYEKVGKFLESRPDLVKKLTNEVQGNGQPEQPRIELDKDEFDPWEAYNDPSSKSYQFRQQELNDTVNNAIASEVDKKVSGIQEQVGMNQLQQDLSAKGLNKEQIDSFMDFAKKPTSEHGLDGAIKMWQAMTGQTEAGQQANNVDPMSMISQNQGTPVAGVLGGEQPERKSDTEAMWDGIMKASSRAKVL